MQYFGQQKRSNESRQQKNAIAETVWKITFSQNFMLYAYSNKLGQICVKWDVRISLFSYKELKLHIVHCHVFQKFRRTLIQIEVSQRVQENQPGPSSILIICSCSEWLSTWVSIHILVTHELWYVLQDSFYLCKLCCIGCTWMVSPQSASSCAAATY